MASSHVHRCLLHYEVLVKLDCGDDLMNLSLVCRSFCLAVRGKISAEIWKILMKSHHCGTNLILAYSFGIHIRSPWHLKSEEDLRDCALKLEAAHRACVSDFFSGGVSKIFFPGRLSHRIRTIEPTVHSEIIKFDVEAFKKICEHWRDNKCDGLHSWPGTELISRSSERCRKKITLSLSWERTSCLGLAKGVGRVLSLNLVDPYDEFCIVHFVTPALPSVKGRWAWAPRKTNDRLDAPPRNIFQTRGEPTGDFQDFLIGVCCGMEIRIIVICTGVSGSHRDPCRRNTLFGKGIKRPWSDVSVS
jgi:hypothetical protein